MRLPRNHPRRLRLALYRRMASLVKVCGVVCISLLLCTCSGGQPGSSASAQGHGVLVIAVDALRADHMGIFGYDRNTTPVMDELCAGAVAFEDTWSAAPSLLPAHCALLTGSDPNVSRRLFLLESEVADESRFEIKDQTPHAAVTFLSAGYRTAAFVDHAKLNPVLGFGSGFQEYSPIGKVNPGTGLAGSDVGLAGTSRRLLDWARGLDRDQDWFSYLQVSDLERVWNHSDPAADGYFEPRPGMSNVPPISNDAEAFFAQPRSRWTGGAVSLGQYEARYDGRLHRLDQELGALFEDLRRAGLWENTTICIVGSFGVQFGEAGLILDHGLYSSADLRVPLIIRPSTGNEFDSGHTSTNLASTEDVIPTLLELSGIPEPPGMVGVSQVPSLVAGGKPSRTFAFASCGYQEGGLVVGPQYALEQVFPGQTLGVHGPGLTRGWFGDEEEHPTAMRERFYDRRLYPLPNYRLQDEFLERTVPDDEKKLLKEAAIDRYFYSGMARRVLHGPKWRREETVEPSVIDKLVELEFLSGKP